MKLAFWAGVSGVILYIIGIVLRGFFITKCMIPECTQPIEVTIFSAIAYLGAIIAIGAMIIIIYKKLRKK